MGCECVDWIHVTQEMDDGKAYSDLRTGAGNSLSCCVTTNFPRRNLLETVSGKWKHFAYFCSQRENIPIWNLRKEWLETFKFLHYSLNDIDHSSIPAQVLFNWLTKRYQLNVRRDVRGDKWIMNRQGCGRRRSPYFSGSQLRRAQTQYRCTSRSQKYGINWCMGLVPSNGHLLR
jgi:hypothetical protein